jgi:hypothetical protein
MLLVSNFAGKIFIMGFTKSKLPSNPKSLIAANSSFWEEYSCQHQNYPVLVLIANPSNGQTANNPFPKVHRTTSTAHHQG